MGIHLHSVLTGMLAVVLATAPVLATICGACCDPDVTRRGRTSAVTASSHGSDAAQPPPVDQASGDEGGAHCTQSADPGTAGREQVKSAHAPARIAPQDRACPVTAVVPATVRAVGRSDVQHPTPSLVAPVTVTWHAATQPRRARTTPPSLFPPPSRTRPPLNLRI